MEFQRNKVLPSLSWLVANEVLAEWTGSKISSVTMAQLPLYSSLDMTNFPRIQRLCKEVIGVPGLISKQALHVEQPLRLNWLHNLLLCLRLTTMNSIHLSRITIPLHTSNLRGKYQWQNRI